LQVINENVFNGCESLAAIDLPKTLTSIGDGAFANCKSLSSIEIPESVTVLGDEAFANCENLKFVAVPPAYRDGIGVICGKDVFKSCSPELQLVFGTRMTWD
jgi:hypothetical protein